MCAIIQISNANGNVGGETEMFRQVKFYSRHGNGYLLSCKLLSISKTPVKSDAKALEAIFCCKFLNRCLHRSSSWGHAKTSNSFFGNRVAFPSASLYTIYLSSGE